MNKTIKNILIVSILIVCVYIVVKMIKKGSPALGLNLNPDVKKKAENCELKDSDSISILYGQNNNSVRVAQCRLNFYHNTSLALDGVFGDETMRALTKYDYRFPLYPMIIGTK